MVGDIVLTEDEKELLRTSPDFAVFATMCDEAHNVEVLSAGVKHRSESNILEEEEIGEDLEEDKE